VSIKDLSVTPEAFHVIRISAEVGGQPLDGTEDAEPLGELKAIFGWRVLLVMLLKELTDDRGWADAFLLRFGFELLFETVIDPDVDAIHILPPSINRQTIP